MHIRAERYSWRIKAISYWGSNWIKNGRTRIFYATTETGQKPLFAYSLLHRPAGKIRQRLDAFFNRRVRRKYAGETHCVLHHHLLDVVGRFDSAERPEIFSRAEIIASGLRVSSTAPASARYSRFCESANRMTMRQKHTRPQSWRPQ